MPQLPGLAPLLTRCLDRANPNVATFVEIAVPDQADVLRRPEDQFLADQPAGPRVSETPAGSTVASPSGALTLSDTDDEIITQYSDDATYPIPRSDPAHFINTVAWELDRGFQGGVLRKVTVRLKWVAPEFTFVENAQADVTLDIFRAHQVAGTFVRQGGTSTVETEGVTTSFVSLLPQPIMMRFADLFANGTIDPATGFADVAFDLTAYRVAIEAATTPPPGPNETGDLPVLYFTIQTNQVRSGDIVEWRRDTTSPQEIAGVGTVREMTWRHSDSDPDGVWKSAAETGATLDIKVAIAQYAATSQEVYALELAAPPKSTSVGRVVFQKGEPAGSGATLELSTDGAAGPWTAVEDGDLLDSAQTQYHARLTLNASADQRRAPVVAALGVEFRQPVDVSAESTVQALTQDVSLPFCQASVGEGQVSVVRTGRRDYRDTAADIAVGGADTQLEADLFLGSRHPQVARGDWFRMARAPISTRAPGAAAETFTLLSILKRLKKKIPAPIEAINQVVTVTAATTAAVTVDADLVGTTALGNEYDDSGYYMRVRSSAQAGVETGVIATISGNTGQRQLDFTGADALAGTLAAGDQIEVHSGTFAQPALAWVDQDPADVWLDILTTQLLIPMSQIGFAGVGSSGRGGLPPRVTDRAPGDAALQAKCKVTLKITDAEDASDLLDQLSFIMGGVTTEIAGQIVFRQIYALIDAAGTITVAPDGVAAVLDARDYANLDTPTGREQRITVLSCDYGVNTASATQGQDDPVSTTVNTDADALATYGTQDVEGLGTATISSDITRWLYNSADGGLQLATFCGRQVIAACSTGIRIWPWTCVNQRPDIRVGDQVTLITDQYTDYDPARQRAIRGWNAYPLTIVGASADGRSFRGFLQGLAGVYGVSARGGTGTLQDQSGASRALLNVRPTDHLGTVDVSWTAGANVAAVLLYALVVLAGSGDDIFDVPTDADVADPSVVRVLKQTPAVLAPDVGMYTLNKAPSGSELAIRLEARDAFGTLTDFRNLTIPAAAFSATPYVTGNDSMAVDVVDPAGVLDPAGRITFNVTPDGGATTRTPATSVTSVTVDGVTTYTYALTGIPLIPKHDVTVQPLQMPADGSDPIPLAAYGFDPNTIADVRTAAVAYVGPNAVVSMATDTDAVVGATGAQYSTDAGATWTNVTVDASYHVAFTIARDPTDPINLLLRGVNAAGEPGPSVPLQIAAYIAEGPTLVVSIVAEDATSKTFAYSGTGILLLSIDDGTPTTPPASPIVVTKDASAHTYKWTATQAGQTFGDTEIVPALGPGGLGRPSVAADVDAGTATVTWSDLLPSSGITRSVDLRVDGGDLVHVDNATSPTVISTTLSATPSGTATVTATDDTTGAVLLQVQRTGPFTL